MVCQGTSLDIAKLLCLRIHMHTLNRRYIEEQVKSHGSEILLADSCRQDAGQKEEFNKQNC